MHGVTMKFVLLYVKQQKDKFEYAWYAVANSRKEITFSLGIWLKAVSTSPLKLELYEELQPASVCVCVCVCVNWVHAAGIMAAIANPTTKL